MLTVNAYRFDVNGLLIIYTYKGQKTTWLLDPCAVCEVFEGLGIIEGFEVDHATGEPVILWEDRSFGRPVVEWCHWCDFISFGFLHRHAEIIAEAKENSRAFRKSQAIINRLLAPVQSKVISINPSLQTA